MSSPCPPKGGGAIGPNPTDRGKTGTKRHIVVDRRGLPLAVVLTGACRDDSRALTSVVDVVHPVRQPRGRPRKRPEKFDADKA
ncbi:transposase [Xanthobacter cornucopiae]|uniref:transposase n=1 Tax=Xanthobacter cornucopiae TaxID=3119924 RepID=UPI00372D0E68